MTEFTSEWVAEQRKLLEQFLSKTHAEILLLQALDEIERLKAENEKLQDLILAYENDLVLLSVYGKLERAEAEIKESNDLLRSAFMIAKRDGKHTNWEAFRGQLNNALERQHKIMYPKEKQ